MKVTQEWPGHRLQPLLKREQIKRQKHQGHEGETWGSTCVSDGIVFLRDIECTVSTLKLLVFVLEPGLSPTNEHKTDRQTDRQRGDNASSSASCYNSVHMQPWIQKEEIILDLFLSGGENKPFINTLWYKHWWNSEHPWKVWHWNCYQRIKDSLFPPLCVVLLRFHRDFKRWQMPSAWNIEGAE